MLKNLLNNLKDCRGQAIVMGAVAVWLFAMFGALSVDVGLLVNERRDVQNAADKAALAGALQLKLESSDTGADALLAADDWAARNGVVGADAYTRTLVHADVCFGGSASSPPLGVMVTVGREPASFAVGLLNLDSWNASATAIACAGRPSDMIGMLPFAISESSTCFSGGAPKLGEFCDIVVDTSASGLIGELGIAPNGACADGNSSANVLKANIINGANVKCAVGDSIQGNSGHNVGKTKSGIETRIAGEGLCDANSPVTNALFTAGNNALNAYSSTPLASPTRGDGHDDFFEVWQYHGDASDPAAHIAPYDCDPSTPGIQTSPRNVTLIVVQDFANPDGAAGPKSYIVQGFARVYLEGCTDKDDDFHKDCDWAGGGKFTVHARFVAQVGLTNSELGYETTYGDIEVFLKQ